MDLNTLWFGILTTLFIGFFFLEGFDFGVGMLMPFLGKGQNERKLITSAIGPFWDGNEVWLIMTVAAMFAAFPHWYATLFSGFYLGALVLLLALIVRGVGFEFRNRVHSRGWHSFWDWMIFIGSLVPGLFWGIVFANLLRGLPIDAKKTFTGNLGDWLNPYALLAGITFVGVFLLHGAIFLNLRTEGQLRTRAGQIARLLWLPCVALLGLFAGASYFATDIYTRSNPTPLVLTIGAVAVLLAGGWGLIKGRSGLAFMASGLTIALATLTLFTGLFPRVMVSSLNPVLNLTVTNAAASPYSLEIMSWLSLGLIPVVIAYQAWTYWVFRQRVSPQTAGHL